MGTVKTIHDGDVTVQVQLVTHPGGTPTNDTFTVTQAQSLDHTWTNLAPGTYAVSISWKTGYHNIAQGTDGNAIIVNGKSMYYQVMGSPADGNGVMGVFGYQL